MGERELSLSQKAIKTAILDAQKEGPQLGFIPTTKNVHDVQQDILKINQKAVQQVGEIISNRGSIRGRKLG